MPQKHISLFTNVSKTQIKETDTTFVLEGVPVTVDNAVMNNILYPPEHNEIGMNTIKDRVVTLSHPINDNGVGADAYAGESLQKFYSGGHIEKHYRTNGIWYVNISINKNLLKAQDANQDTNFYERLENRQDIGVSTGLYAETLAEKGVTTNGQKYEYIATKQNYNHLAMLESSEPPAGGDATFMRFNSENNVDSMVINIADYMPESIPDEKDEVDVEVDIKDDGFTKLLAKLSAILSVLKLTGNDQNLNAEKAEEDNNMSIKEKINALKASKCYKENMTDDEVNSAYDKMTKKADNSASDDAQDSAVLSAINALTEKLDAQNATIEALQNQLNAKDKAEKDALVNELKDMDIGISEAGLQALQVNDLKGIYEQATATTFSINARRKDANNSGNDYSDSFLDVEV